MQGTANAVQTAALTIVGGVLIYVIGQLLMKFLIEPFHEFRKLLGEIASLLTYSYGVGAHQIPLLKDGFLSSLPKNVVEIKGDLLIEIMLKQIEKVTDVRAQARHQASQLSGMANRIPAYCLWERVHLLPKRKLVHEAVAELFELSRLFGDFGPEFDIEDRDKLTESIAEKLEVWFIKPLG